MKKKIIIGIIVFLVGLVIVSVTTVIFVVRLKYQTIESNPNVSFIESDCDKNVDPYAENFKNLITSKWEDDKFVVGGIVSTNCASSVKSVDYKLEGNNIIVKHEVSECNPCASCMCAKNLEVKISGLEKKDYKVIFE